MPPGCTGRGSHQIFSNDTVSDANDAGESRQSTRQAAIVSSSRCARASKSSPAASNSSRCQPTPTPSSSRPCDSTSSVAAVFASTIAGRSGAIRIPVASRTREVAPAIAASTVSGSSHGTSIGNGNVPHS